MHSQIFKSPIYIYIIMSTEQANEKIFSIPHAPQIYSYCLLTVHFKVQALGLTKARPSFCV